MADETREDEIGPADPPFAGGSGEDGARPDDRLDDERHDEENRLKPDYIRSVREALEEGDKGAVYDLVEPLHPADIADLLELHERDERGALAAAITDRARNAREGALSWAELSGSTLTVTNVGVFGVDGGVPILNPRQSAIVALGTVRRRPWEHAGEVALRDVVTVTVSFDHRVLDGAEAAAFLTDITDVLSDPALTLAR